jgi:hypothetical protein
MAISITTSIRITQKNRSPAFTRASLGTILQERRFSARIFRGREFF